MKVLHVIESLDRGGAERVLATLARALRHDLEFHVVSLVGRGPLTDDLRLAGAQVYSLDLAHRRDFWRALPLLGRLVHRVAPDILHAHLRFSELYAASIPAPRHTRRVATFHNLGYDAGPMSAVDHATRLYERVVVRRQIDRFFAVSRQSAQSYERHLELPPVDVIYNPVDVERVRRFAQHRGSRELAQRLRARGPLVVQAGSFRPLKGHDVALAALKACAPEHRFVWVCVGDGPERAKLSREVEAAQLGPWVHFTGEADYDDTLGWLAEADVVIQPSRAEGVPLVLLEAMALERPVVATRVGGIPEVVTDGETALLVLPEDAVGLRDAVLSSVPPAEAMAARVTRAREVVDTKYDAPLIARQWLNAYAGVLSGD